MSKKTKFGLTAFLSSTLGTASTVIVLSYATYCYTDLGHVNSTAASAAMTLVSTLGLVISLFSGVFLQRSKSKNGQYRPWALWTYILTCAGAFLMVFDYGNPTLTVALISVGYFISAVSMDISFTAIFGVYEKMSEGDSEIRNLTSGMHGAGANCGYIFYGGFFLALVNMLGGGNENTGYALSNALLLVLTVIGAFILYKVSKPYDKDNRNTSVEVEKVSLMETFKSAFANRLILGVAIGDMLRYGAYYTFYFILIYQCQYVLGDWMAYSVAMVITSVGGVIGSLIAPWVIAKIGGRKKTAIVIPFLYGIVFVVMGFVGDTYWGLMITFGLASLLQFIFDSVDMMMYLDAGEVWYNKTGNDTRAYAMSVCGIVSKVGQILASVGFGVVLGAINYMDGMEFPMEAATTLTRCIGFIPAAGCFLFVISMLIFHNVSDKEIERCIAENAEKDAALYGNME